MKIIHLSTEVDEVSAAFRIHEAVKKQGVTSCFLALKKTSDNQDIKEIEVNKRERVVNKWIKLLDDEILKHFYRNRENVVFSSALSTGYRITDYNEVIEADIIHIHWISAGFLALENIRELIRLNKPIIWTLHDKWLLTGGCHVGCNRFYTGCGECKVLNSFRKKDYSNFTIRAKKKFFKNNNFYLIAPSRWMLNNIKNSMLFCENSCMRIPNTLNTNIFQKYTLEYVERQLGYKREDKYHILFGADSIRIAYKGFGYFVKMLRLLEEEIHGLKDKIMIHLVGGDNEQVNDALAGFEIKKWGFIKKQETMALIYNLVDVYVHTSVADNFPGMILESMACQLPVVAFDVEGISDLITHKKEGYLAKKANVRELLNGVVWCMNHQNSEVGKKGREKVENEFSEELVGTQYFELYKQIIGGYSI